MEYLIRRARAVTRGKGFTSKAKLATWALLDSTPRTVLMAFPFLKPPLQALKNKLLKGVIIDVNGVMFRPIDSESVFILQPEFEEWMWSYLRVSKGGVFIDVGAHIGKYTIPMAKAIGDSGLVIAVEPHLGNYKLLVENIRLNSVRNVIALNIAAWSEERWMKPFIGDIHGHHSLVYDFGRGFVLVRARPLDNVLEELGINRVDCIKVDVEGAELEVFKGLRRTLKRFKPIVVAEIRDEYLSEVKDLSQKLGYVMKRIAPMYYVLEPR